MAATSVRVRIQGDQHLQALLDQLPKLVVAAGGPADRAVRKGTNVIAKRARQVAPDSRRTGTKKKQSSKSRNIWKYRVRQKIRAKLVRYANGSYGVVGPKSPEGNAANFVQGTDRRHVLWGKSTAIAKYRYARNWMKQAFDETKSEQAAAMRASLTADIAENMKGRR